jgi:hypothetical protein
MKWVKERDLLIAQALAFVQSVSGKKEDAGKPVAEPEIEAAPIDVVNDDTIQDRSIGDRSIADSSIKDDAIKIVAPVRDIPANIGVSRTVAPSDFRTEIQNRVANFRAHQERFHREREEYFSATLAKARAGFREDLASPPPRK